MRKTIRSKEQLQMYIQSCQKFFDRHKECYVSYEKIPKKRSVKQNKLLHVWINCWCESQGEKNDQVYISVVKMELKKMFLPLIEIIGLKGKYKIPTPTSSLDTIKFNTFLESIHEYFLNEYSFRLLWPEDKEFEDFYQAYK